MGGALRRPTVEPAPARVRPPVYPVGAVRALRPIIDDVPPAVREAPDLGGDVCPYCRVGMGVESYVATGGSPLPAGVARRWCGHAMHAACDVRDNCPVCQKPKKKPLTIAEATAKLRAMCEAHEAACVRQIDTVVTGDWMLSDRNWDSCSKSGLCMLLHIQYDYKFNDAGMKAACGRLRELGFDVVKSDSGSRAVHFKPCPPSRRREDGGLGLGC